MPPGRTPPGHHIGSARSYASRTAGRIDLQPHLLRRTFAPGDITEVRVGHLIEDLQLVVHQRAAVVPHRLPPPHQSQNCFDVPADQRIMADVHPPIPQGAFPRRFSTSRKHDAGNQGQDRSSRQYMLASFTTNGTHQEDGDTPAGPAAFTVSASRRAQTAAPLLPDSAAAPGAAIPAPKPWGFREAAAQTVPRIRIDRDGPRQESYCRCRRER